MGIKATITQIIEDELKNSDHFLVGVKSNEDETALQFYIDGLQGVGISTCSKLSRTISKKLDEMELDVERLKYEVSSPGADKPLVDVRQYHQHLGRNLEITLNDGAVINGKLLKVDEAELLLEIIKDKKKKIKETIPVKFDQVQVAKVLISFKSVKK